MNLNTQPSPTSGGLSLVWASGFQPMWLVALITVTVVTALGVLLARQPRLSGWLRR